jgi:hypothetical protein
LYQTISLTGRRYTELIKTDYKTALLSAEPALYMNFFEWMANTSRKKTKHTFSLYWKCLSQYYSLLAERRIDGAVLEQMRRVSYPTPRLRVEIVAFSLTPCQHINTRFRAEHKVAVRHKEKHTMSVHVLGLLLLHRHPAANPHAPEIGRAALGRHNDGSSRRLEAQTQEASQFPE